MTKMQIAKIAGASVFALALMVNLQFAFAGYGIKTNTLNEEVLGQMGSNVATTTAKSTTAKSPSASFSAYPMVGNYTINE